jgi:hypothetical protein
MISVFARHQSNLTTPTPTPTLTPTETVTPTPTPTACSWQFQFLTSYNLNSYTSACDGPFDTTIYTENGYAYSDCDRTIPTTAGFYVYDTLTQWIEVDNVGLVIDGGPNPCSITPTPTLTPTETPTPSVTPTITPTTTPTVTETPTTTPTPTTSPISSGNVQMDFYNDLSATTVTNIFINVVNYSSGIFPMSPGESGIITGITQTSYGEVGLQINYNFGSEGTAKYIYVYVDGSLDRTTSTFFGITFNIGTTIPVQNNSVITVRQYNNPLSPTETPTPTPTNSLTPTFTPTVTPTETTSVTNITLSFNYSLGSGSVSWCNETLSELSQSTCDAVAASYQVQSYYGTSISVGTQFLGSQALSQCWVTNSNYPFSTVWTSGSTEYIIETDNTGVVTRYDSFVVCDNVNVTPTLTPTFTPTLTMTPTYTVTPTVTLTPTITQTSTPTPTITPNQLILNQDYILMADASSSNYLFDESNNNVTNGGKVTTMIDANGRNYSASVRVGLSTGDKPVWNSNIFNGKGGITFQSGILDDGFNFTTATFTPLGNTFASVSVLKIDSSLSSDYGQVFNFAQGYGSDRNYFYGSLFFSQSGLAWAWGGSLNSIGNAISYLLISPDFSPYEPHTYLLYSTSSGVDLYIDGAYIKTVSSSPSFGVSDFGFSRNLTLTTLRPEFTFFEYSLVSGTTVNNTNQQTFINTYQEKYRTYNLSGFNLISAFLPKNYNPSSPSTLNATTFSSSSYQSSTSLTLTGITTSGAGNDQYLVLDGTTSRIVIGGAPISNILTVGGTMTFTFKLNNLNKNQIIYSTYHSGGDTSYIKVNTNNQLEFYILKSGNTVNSFTGTTVLSSETTYIVQLVSSSDLFTLLLDGVSVGSTSYSQNISIFEHNIGARYDAQTSLYTDFLDGSLGVMLFDRNDFSETPRSQNRLAIKYRYNLH